MNLLHPKTLDALGAAMEDPDKWAELSWALAPEIVAQLRRTARLHAAADDLAAWCPENGYRNWPDVYEVEDGDPDPQWPFFSEGVLYPLLGKDDARGLLGRLRAVKKR